MTDTLHLDKRQRAMLAEMGVRVWSPLSEAVVTAAPAVEPEAAQSFAAASDLATQAIANAAGVDTAARHILIQRPDGIDHMDWAALHSTVSGCQACTLCSSRQNTVFGVGAAAHDSQAPQVDWLIVGEAPGEDEDRQGEPFAGQAGQLLNNMLAAMQLSRTGPRTSAGGGVFITNVLKCRPPGSRNPKPEEVAQCLPYLERQVALLQPKMILAMGRFAVQALLRDTLPEVDTTPLGKLRGRVHHYQNVPVVVTYHPAYVLRNLPEKAKVWADLCLAMAQVKGPA